MKYINTQLLINLTTITLFVLLAFLFLNLANIGLPVEVTTTNRSSELSVVGEGKVDVVPDTVYVDVGIQVTNVGTVEAAQAEINQVNNDIIAAMTGLGIEKKDIKTSNYSIYPNYNYENGQDRITGYNGNVTVTIKSSQAELVSQIIQEATAAGANQVQGTRFEVADPQKYREEARSQAIANAKKQAQKLANDLDIHLGKVVNVVEYTSGGGDYPQPYAFRESAVGLGGGNGPDIQTGTQTITSTVTLFFEKR